MIDRLLHVLNGSIDCTVIDCIAHRTSRSYCACRIIRIYQRWKLIWQHFLSSTVGYHETRALVVAKITISIKIQMECVCYRIWIPSLQFICLYDLLCTQRLIQSPSGPPKIKNEMKCLQNCLACMRIGCGCKLNAHLL